MKYTNAKLEHGYANKILTIDVGSGDIAAQALNPEIRDYFIGGRSLGLFLLHQSITPRTRAHDPEDPLIFANGPLGGIPQFPGTAKAMAISLSPLTGIPGVSNFGGYFGAYLKYAGFDALKLTGKAGQETIVVIDGFRHEVFVEPSPEYEEVFDLERAIVDRFTAAGYDKRHIAFMSTGTGADVMKPIAAPMIGGMISSAIHVLIMTPVIFVMMKVRDLRKGRLKYSGMRH